MVGLRLLSSALAVAAFIGNVESFFSSAGRCDCLDGKYITLSIETPIFNR